MLARCWSNGLPRSDGIAGTTGQCPGQESAPCIMVCWGEGQLVQRLQEGGVVVTAGGHSSDCSPVTVGGNGEHSRWPSG